jgi:hypothetical protein
VEEEKDLELKKDHDMTIQDKPEEQIDPKDPVAEVVFRNGQYWVYNKLDYNKDQDYTENPEKQIWYSVKDFRGSASSLGFKLRDSDIMKFGRARLKVVKIKTENSLLEEVEFKKSELRDMLQK